MPHRPSFLSFPNINPSPALHLLPPLQPVLAVMSSFQAMTAPAVGHRPPESAADMSLYDYGAPRAADQHPPSPPDSDSADVSSTGSAMHGAPSDTARSPPPNGLPTVSGFFDIKTEPQDETGMDGPDLTMRRQSAADALLAQLLRDQESGPAQSAHQDQSHDGQAEAQDANGLPNAETAESGQNQTGSDVQSHMHNGEGNDEGIPEEERNRNTPSHTGQGQIEGQGLSDLLGSTRNPEQATDFSQSFDMNAVPTTAFEALQQNEMLTAAYLSQGTDLTALGYSHGPPHRDGTGSANGSEPRIQAFAKLEFDDGHFYVNTYSFTLGRDIRAARAAHHREVQARQVLRHSRKSSSGGNKSAPTRVKQEGSGILGSVVSDRGGIMGFDPDVPPHLPSHGKRKPSESSHSDGPVHATPAQLHTKDYNALAMESLYGPGADAKPVDTLSLLPSPESCPTIPIHPPATVDGSAAGHRGISRKHVKISYNFDKDLFEMEVIGRNGAFIGADWLSPGQIRPLHNGDYIQIGGVRIRFLLPDVPPEDPEADGAGEPDFEEIEHVQPSVEAEDQEERRPSDVSEEKDASKATKIVLKTKEPDPSQPMPSIEGPTDPQPARRRGPGRPPKDGIMSKRERAELAREQKLAAKREANGGITPPPVKAKGGKTTKDAVIESPEAKTEKRKYTKRKKPDGTPIETPFPPEGFPMPMDQRPEEYKVPPAKKRKPSRSPSPNYPPESAYTPEDLAKPPYNYAVLIFDALTDAGTPMTLKQIYRSLKLKYPYFRFKCETEGWTSSVRHNLNGNGHLFMHAERDGKGWSWQLRPGASVEKEKKRRPSPPPPSSQPPPTPSGQHYMPMANPYTPASDQNMAHQHFQQFPSMPSNPYPAPAPQSSPYHPPPQTQVPGPFPIPSPIRNNLPAAFAQTTPSTYKSPYASDPPPQPPQFQQPAKPPQPPHQSPHYPPQPPPPANSSPHPPPAPNSAPTQQPAPPPAPAPAPANQAPTEQNAPVPAQTPPAAPPAPGPGSSFIDRANKAIDDFEAVLVEDYDDKNYIREVLKSARARALGQKPGSSFPGGEPKDEAVILGVLENLVGSLKGE